LPTALAEAQPATQDIFRCSGLDQVALQMRRRVQAGMALEFFGTQVSNLVFHDGMEVISTISDTSNFIMLLHLYVVWKYAAFTRDHLMARHVTRIALLEPRVPMTEGGGCCAQHSRAVLSVAEPLSVLVETGPWTRRLELMPGPGGATVPLGQLVRLGGLHVDRAHGEVLDVAALEVLIEGGHYIASEELVTDVEAKERASIGNYEVPPLLQEDTSGAYQWMEQQRWLHGPLQWPGSRAMQLFGFTALAMGAGTVLIWLPVPLPGMGERKPRWQPSTGWR